MFLQTAVNNTDADTKVQPKHLSGPYDLMSKPNVDYRLANATQQSLPRFMKAYAQVTPPSHLFDRSNLNIVTPATPNQVNIVIDLQIITLLLGFNTTTLDIYYQPLRSRH